MTESKRDILVCWQRTLANVCVSRSRCRDDGLLTHEVLGLCYQFAIPKLRCKEIETLRQRDAPPIRNGSVDTAGGSDYWRLIRSSAMDGAYIRTIDLLKRRPETKRACLSFPVSERERPCLSNLDFKLRDGELHLNAFFRSQDVWRRLPANLVFLTEVAWDVAAQVDATPGRAAVMIGSAHVCELDVVPALAHLRATGFSLGGHAPARRPVVAIIGKERMLASDSTHVNALALAREAGFRAAASGATVLTGGLGGIMAAASEGARLAGGVSIGILPAIDPAEERNRVPNPYQNVAIRTGLEQRVRIRQIVESVDVLLAVHGGGGTRAEAELALKQRIPVVTIQGSGAVADELAAEAPRKGLHVASDAMSGVALALSLATNDSMLDGDVT